MSSTSGVTVGCSGFSGAREAYFQRFKVVEVQQSFFEPPPLATATRWRSEAPANFEYAVKAWQLITHEAGSPTYRKLAAPLDPGTQQYVGGFKPSPVVWNGWQRTRDFARVLRAKVILFQCPASFKPTPQNIANMRQFFQTAQRDASILGLEFQYVWEPRAEWPVETVRELCAELNLAHAVDPFVQMPVTDWFCYFRLPGIRTFRHRYTDAELTQLAEKTRQFQAGCCLFNNLLMREDADRFLNILEGRGAAPAE